MNETMRPLIEGYIDLNIALILALGLWFGFRAIVARTRYAQAYTLQKRLLSAILLITLVSPFAAPTLTAALASFWPQHSLALTDMAVAAFLDGRIAMQAVTFEGLLTTRQRWLDSAFSSGSSIVLSLWLALLLGFALALFRLLRATRQVRQTLRQSFRWRATRRVEIRISDTSTMPFAVRGIRRHYVVLPANLVMRPQDMRLVLAHEFLHIRKGDTELELIVELLRPFFFWNPAFRLWKAQLEQLRELSCDQIVVQRGAWRPEAYAKCLVDVCARTLAKPSASRMQVGFIQSRKAKRDLERRITALCTASDTPPPVWSTVGVTLVVALAFAATLSTVIIRPAQDWSQDRLMLSTVVNLERLQQINRGF